MTVSEETPADTPALPEAPAATVAQLTAADLIRGGAADTEQSPETAVPRSRLTRSTDLPAGLRRRSIGLYDMPVSAGVGEFLADSTRIEDISIPDDPRTAEADYALRINGDSMEPKYHDGDILIVSAEKPVRGEVGIYTMDGQGYVKVLGNGELLSLNSAYAPIPMKEGIICNGKVIGVLDSSSVLDG